MMRTLSRSRLAAHRILFVLAWVAASQLTLGARAESDVAIGPRITSARVGLNDYYKLGFWTPMSVEIDGLSNAEAIKSLRVEVKTIDSDGVPTLASAPVAAPDATHTQASTVVYTQ